MASKRLSLLKHEWNLDQRTHESAIEQLERNTGLDLDTFRDLPEGYRPEVEVGAYMSALREVDGRSWHDRMVDALTQKFSDILESSDYDIMIRELDVNHSDSNYNRAEPDKRYRSEALEGLGLPITDLDFAMISFEEDEIKLDYWDLKIREQDLEKSDLSIKVNKAAEEVSRRGGVGISPSRNEMYSQEVGLTLDGRRSSFPHIYSGDYRVAEDFEFDENEEIFSKFINKFMGYESVEELEEIEKVRDVDEFLS